MDEDSRIEQYFAQVATNALTDNISYFNGTNHAIAFFYRAPLVLACGCMIYTSNNKWAHRSVKSCCNGKYTDPRKQCRIFLPNTPSGFELTKEALTERMQCLHPEDLRVRRTIAEHRAALEKPEDLTDEYYLALKCGCSLMFHPSYWGHHKGVRRAAFITTCFQKPIGGYQCRYGLKPLRMLTKASEAKFWRTVKEEDIW